VHISGAFELTIHLRCYTGEEVGDSGAIDAIREGAYRYNVHSLFKELFTRK